MANVDVNRVAGNIGALNSLYSLRQVNQDLATRQARLQTGKRLLSAADDPAGMNIATSLHEHRHVVRHPPQCDEDDAQCDRRCQEPDVHR